MSSRRSRGFCFTLNNPTLGDELNARIIDAHYIVTGNEVAPTTNTPHLQGYVYFKAAKTLSAVIRLLPRAHFIIARGTPKQNATYCKKSGDFFEKPSFDSAFPGQGARTDLAAACQLMINGGLAAVADAMPTMVVRYHRGLEALAAARVPAAPKTYLKKNVHWFFGPTGSGKSRAAYDHDIDLWKHGRNLNWFCGYAGQKTVLFDDFRTNWPGYNFSLILALTDGYPMTVAVKGGTVKWYPTDIFFICPVSPHEMFQTERHEDIEQLGRRITAIKQFMFD